MKRRRREERRRAVNDRASTGPAFIVGKMGSVIEWTPEKGWTRNGEPFTPDPAPLSQEMLAILRENKLSE